MTITVDTNKKLIQMKSSVNAKELFEYLQNQYGADWVNYKIVPHKPYRSDTFIENHYHPEPSFGYIGTN